MMAEIPHNIGEFFVSAIPRGRKCILYFKSFRVCLRDESGYEVAEFKIKGKHYDGTVLEAYLC